MIVVLIGPSGAGKGTQADRIAEDDNFLHVSLGDLFREHIERDTSLGRKVRQYLERGELVPEDIAASVIRTRIQASDPGQDIVIDGFPRTAAQASALDEILREMGRELEAAVYLSVDDEDVIEERIPGRLTCRVCQRPYHERFNPPKKAGMCDRCGGPLYHRLDDTREFADARLRTFHREVTDVIDHYDRAGRLIVLDGGEAIEPVHESMEDMVDSLRAHRPVRATPDEIRRIQALKAPPRTLPREAAPETMDLVLLGAPGSGKGTQAGRLRETLDVPHIATGDLFRAHLKDETELGQLARAYMERGDLVPDDITQGMVRDRLRRDDTKKGFLLDGFPRTLPQAEALADMLTDLGRRLSAVLYIHVPDDVLVHRLSGRLICSNCQRPWHAELAPPKVEGVCDVCGGELQRRDDDAPETVRDRLRTYHRKTAPLIDFYRNQGVLVEIDGDGDVDAITATAVDAIEAVTAGE